MLLLHLSAPFALTPQQLARWQGVFDQSIALGAATSTELSPLELVVELGGTYEVREVSAAIVDAFARIAIAEGEIEFALSEHDSNDTELETPPFYQGRLDLARGQERAPELVQVQVEIMQGEPFTAIQLELLERALRAQLPWPVASFVAVSPSLPGRHLARLELVPMPEAELPARAELKANTARAIVAARQKPLRVRVGAYVGTWDHTLFDETL
jgi:hypothetical protein